MDVPFFLAIFLLSHLLLLHSFSAKEDNKNQSTCPKSFDCKPFHHPLKFPFSNSTYPQSIPGGVICLLIFIISCRKKWDYISSCFVSRKTSTNPSSKDDIEGGTIFFGVHVFSYTELEEATNNFDPFQELGDGGFGTVYHGKLRDGRDVAVKCLYEHNSKRVTQFINEVQILTCLRHRNLVSLYGCTSRHSRELLLVYEYIPNGTLADHLHDSLIERMTTLVAELALQCLQREKEMRPTMDEVLEALKEIQEYKYDTIGEEIDTVGVLNSTQPPPSPESNDVVLLKNSKAALSLDSVTDRLVSTSAKSISSG
ncbi:LEAF RUST 10 DISEASE-RESISTANCE LOCUS RECEPTOR-LIKE PROTEIN KINASE-like 1.2 [Camellia lanceoleosa]|uniref:LEAF RUST 10 DISEASE-RESISTANCE LOCUS RECEPTOR-LIKE PROTEIN KINASE-like 1.2 n=1 Tax=Camellia lanceoleosa TaxID=1840588 RepID=A0ACC0G5X4_9ERIC|nr:LEAF RUST 10 DISEASE-RESISTANCE LOCUS RECEPTOR-LIKE PROTEIN KINASE-like 1.2 [Camellia lanceoleosa]